MTKYYQGRFLSSKETTDNLINHLLSYSLSLEYHLAAFDKSFT